MIQALLVLSLAVLCLNACSQASASPPNPVPKTVVQDAAASGKASSKSAGSTMGGLLGAGQTETDYAVRDRQLKALTAKRDTLTNQLYSYQQYRTQLVMNMDSNDRVAFTNAQAGSLGASIAGGVVGVAGASAVAALSQPSGTSSGGGSQTQYNADGTVNDKNDGSGSSYSSSGNPAAAPLATAFSTAGTSITTGLATDAFNSQLKAGIKTVSASIAAQTAQYDATIANLQAQIAAVNAQIDALNAQKLKQ